MKRSALLLATMFVFACGDDAENNASNNANNANNGNNANNQNNANNANNGNNQNNGTGNNEGGICNDDGDFEIEPLVIEDGRLIFEFDVPQGWSPIETEPPPMVSYLVGTEVPGASGQKNLGYEIQQELTVIADPEPAKNGFLGAGFSVTSTFMFDGEQIEVIGSRMDNQSLAYMWLPSPNDDGFVSVIMRTRMTDPDVECSAAVILAEETLLRSVRPKENTTFPNL